MAPELYSDEAGPMSALMFSMNVSGRKESEFPARRSEMMGTRNLSPDTRTTETSHAVTLEEPTLTVACNTG